LFRCFETTQNEMVSFVAIVLYACPDAMRCNPKPKKQKEMNRQALSQN
jgi:hypothetical protein